MADIYSVADLRQYAPDDLKNVSDERLILEYSNEIGRDPFEVATMLGVKTGRDRSAFGAGVSSGADAVQGIGISAAAGAADLVGADRAAANLRESAEDQSYQAYLAGRPELERIEDQSLSTLPGYAAYQLGKQAPIMGTVVGAQFVPGLGQVASATGLARAGAMAPRMLGGGGVSRAAMSRMGPMTAAEASGLRQGAAVAKSTMVGSGLGFGSLYESSAADGDPDPWRALAMAPLYGASEAVVPAALTGVARLKTGGYTGRLPTRMLKGGAISGTTEAATELAQTELELSLDPTLTPEERQSARLNAAVAGGLVGGTLGTGTGLRAAAERERQRVLKENEVGELDMATSEAPAPAPAPVREMEQTELDLAPSFQYEDGRDEIGAPDPFRSNIQTPPETSEAVEVETEFDNENQGVLDLPEPEPVVGAQQNKILSRADALQLNAQIEAKQTSLNRLEKFKSKAKDPKVKKANEAKKAQEAEKLRAEIARMQQNLADSDAAVDQRVVDQSTPQIPAEPVEVTQEADTPVVTSEQRTEPQLQAQQDLAAETEADGVTLVDGYEAKKIGQTVDKLNAEIQATEGKAGGRVTLPKGVLTGITAMIRSSNTRPAVRAYKDGTADIDPEYMDQYGEQMRKIHESVMQLVGVASEAYNAASNVHLGVQEEKKESRQASRKDRRDRYSGARKKLDQAMTKFVNAAGGAKNAEAIIASLKTRNEKNRSGRLDRNRFAKKAKLLNKKEIKSQSQYENALDIVLSSAFKEYKDGTLLELDVVRGAPTRRNFVERALGRTAPLTDADAAAGILGILDRVSSYKGTTSAYAKSLANEIRKVFEELVSDNDPVNVEFLEDNGQPKPNYDPVTNTISIHREASQEEILHESLHAAMQFFVYQNPDSPYVQALSNSLDTLFDFVDSGQLDSVNMSDQHKARALEVTNLLRGLRETGNELDAVLELAAYGNTMRDFRMLLKEIKEEPSEASRSWAETLGTLWEQLVEMFANLLGVSGKVANNVLDNTLAILNNSSADMRDPNVGGNRLDMSVLADNDQGPVDADGAPVGKLYRDAAERGQRNGILSTQFLFDAIGFEKGKEWTEAKLSDAAAFIRRELPGVERTITYFNSRFSLPPSLHRIFDIFKEQRNSVYMVMERLASYVESQPKEKVIALMEYMDGNLSALDGFENSAKLKEEADIVLEGLETFIRNLPEELQAEYDGRAFSEYLVYVTSENTVSTQSLGMSKLGDQIKAQGVEINKVDFDINADLIDTDMNGDPDMDGPFYKVIVKTPVRSYPLMVSKSLYERNGGQLPIVDGPYKVDTTREFASIKLQGKNYRFKSKFDYREALDAQKAKDLANAMRNTVGGLANFYSSRNFLNALAIQGKESGVVFDNEAELEASGLLGDGQDIYDPGRSEDEQVRQALRRTGAWVRMPNNPDTYGELADKLVHGPVYFAMRDMADRKPLVNVRAYNDTLRFFKKSKTIYNLGTHVTNVASNVTLAMLHDIPLKTVADAARLMYKYETDSNSLSSAELAVMREFMRSGAMLGNYSSVEVKNVMFKSMAKHLKPKQETVMTRVSALMAMEADKANMASQLVKRGQKIDDVATQLYAAEDNVFRLAAFVKAAGDMAAKEGVSNPDQNMLQEAGRFARQAFLDYDIDAPAVKFLRQSFMPFVSWTYAITPVLGRIAANQPWKIANVLSAYYLLDIGMSALAGDDEEMRKLGPERLDERMFGFGGRMHIRIPFLGDDENPVYYRLGDYVPLASTAKGLPNGFMGMDWFPGGLTPTGPFINAIVATVGGVDPYTGKPIHRPEDDTFDKLANIGTYGYDLIFSPMVRSDNIAKVRDAIQGNVNPYSGREVGVSNLIFARIGGLKFVDFNVDEQAGFREANGSRVMRDYKAAINRAQREAIAKGYPDYEALDAEIQGLYEEMYEEYNKAYRIEDED